MIEKKAWELRQKGLSYRKIAEELNLGSHNTAKNLIKKYQSDQKMTKKNNQKKTVKRAPKKEEKFHGNSKFSSETLDLVKWMVRSGLTNKQMSKELNITESTFYRWLDAYPKLREVVKENKQYVDQIVEDSLLKRALGYEYEEVTKEQKFGKMVTTKIVKKEVAPDVTAQKMWLINRQPQKWNDRHNIEMKAEHTLENLSKEQILEALEELRKLNG